MILEEFIIIFFHPHPQKQNWQMPGREQNLKRLFQFLLNPRDY